MQFLNGRGHRSSLASFPANSPSKTSTFSSRPAWRKKSKPCLWRWPMPNFISEDQIERALVEKLTQLYGFDSLNCYTEDPENLNDRSGRANKREVILVD